MTEQELREKIATRIYDSHWRDGSAWNFSEAKEQSAMESEVRLSYSEADQYLSLIKESYVRLADDQMLPDSFGVNSETRRAQRVMQDDMLKAGFRKVEL